MRPVKAPLRNGTQAIYSLPILAKWAMMSSVSSAQKTNHGSPSSVTPQSVRMDRWPARTNLAALCRYASSCSDQPCRSVRTMARNPALPVTGWAPPFDRSSGRAGIFDPLCARVCDVGHRQPRKSMFRDNRRHLPQRGRDRAPRRSHSARELVARRHSVATVLGIFGDVPGLHRSSSLAGGGEDVPIRRFLGDASFDPEAVAAISAAFEEALRILNLDRNDPLAEIVASKIIGLARTGDRDPMRMSAFVVNSMRRHGGISRPNDGANDRS